MTRVGGKSVLRLCVRENVVEAADLLSERILCTFCLWTMGLHSLYAQLANADEVGRDSEGHRPSALYW